MTGSRTQILIRGPVNYWEAWGFSCVTGVRSGGMITILSALVSVLSFRFAAEHRGNSSLWPCDIS